jgi:hypothetical protein
MLAKQSMKKMQEEMIQRIIVPHRKEEPGGVSINHETER